MIKNFKQFESAKSLEITDEMLDKFVKKYNKKYKEFFTNIFNNFRDTLIETINTHDINQYNHYTYQFIEHLNYDMDNCKQILNNELNILYIIL